MKTGLEQAPTIREIKFRAWDGERMQNRCTFLIDISDGALLDTKADDYVDWPVMQYTGLKDKKGKEIYEGDIVRCGWFYGDDFGNEVGEMQFDNQLVKFAVGPQGSGFNLNVHGMENAEIIGNIYENPELLS